MRPMGLLFKFQPNVVQIFSCIMRLLFFHKFVRLIVNKDQEMNALHDLLNKSMNVGSPHLCCKALFYFILNSAQKLVESYD